MNDYFEILRKEKDYLTENNPVLYIENFLLDAYALIKLKNNAEILGSIDKTSFLKPNENNEFIVYSFKGTKRKSYPLKRLAISGMVNLWAYQFEVLIKKDDIQSIRPASPEEYIHYNMYLQRVKDKDYEVFDDIKFKND